MVICLSLSVANRCVNVSVAARSHPNVIRWIFAGVENTNNKSSIAGGFDGNDSYQRFLAVLKVQLARGKHCGQKITLSFARVNYLLGKSEDEKDPIRFPNSLLQMPFANNSILS
jgi:hypothetical protein